MVLDIDHAFPLILKGLGVIELNPHAKDKVADEARALQRSKKNIERFLADVANGYDAATAGSINNVDYKEWKFFINRCFEDAWRNLISEKYTYSGRWEQLPNDVYTFERQFSYPQLHTIAGYLKKANATKSVHPLVDDVRALFTEMAPLGELNDKLKTMIQKRQPKALEDVKVKYLAPPVGTPSAQVLAVLTQAVDTSFQALLTNIENRYLSIAANHPKKVAEWKPLKDQREYSLYHLYMSGRVQAYEAFNILSKILKADGKTFLPDYKAIITKIARQEADDVRTDFLVKNIKKINSIVEKKGDFKSCRSIENTVRIEGFEGSFFIEFADGASFYFVNSVIWSSSKYGKPFRAYPLRFHHVMLSNGEKMSRPSEKRMHEIFVKG